jgi:hypothetical protein
MPDAVSRVNYFDHQFLRAEDFTHEQLHHVDMRRAHNRLLHTWGVAEGLDIGFASGASRVTVQSGTAVDGLGRELVLPADEQTSDLSSMAGKTLFVTLEYEGKPTHPTSETGVTGDTRFTEKPIVGVRADGPEDPSIELVLGRVTVGADGRLTDKDEGEGQHRRRVAGAVGGDLEVRSLTLSDPGVDPSQWSRMHLRAAGRAELDTTLSVKGNIDVTGKVDGRDVSADGTKLDQHVANESNPHKTTAAQVNALPTTGGTVNGNVSVTGSLGVGGTVDGRDVSADGTNLDAHRAARNNPHGTTAAQVGALSASGGSVSGNISVGTGSVGIGASAPNEAGRLFVHRTGPFAGWFDTRPSGSDLATGLLSMVTPDGGAGWNPSAVVGYSSVANTRGGYFAAPQGTPALHVQGTATFTGAKSGYVADIAVNGSDHRLQVGDLLKLSGSEIQHFYGDLNYIPVPEVVPADSAEDSLVIGVVAGEATPLPGEPDKRVEPGNPTFVEPGGRLSMVTLGCFANCHVDASEGPIRVGDLLTSSANPGHAKKAADPKLGTVIGKALEPLAEGTGYIAVFVNIQ